MPAAGPEKRTRREVSDAAERNTVVGFDGSSTKEKNSKNVDF